MRADADAAQIKAVGVPTGLHGDVGFGVAIAVAGAGFHQQVHFVGVGLEHPALQLQRQIGAAFAMIVVGIFIDAA